jgi:DtxR family transcriptional regulator, Mn-dependent transcriptional regulator
MPVNRQVNINTESVDNYLKAVLALGGSEDRAVSSSALAQRLKVAPASVTNMLQKLASAAKPLVEYEKHRGVRLSAEGKRRALEVLRHHRLIETFLYQVLDYPLEEVHEEAERLEHFISERFEERIAAKLGNPRFDPHGHCIPAIDGRMPKQVSTALTSIERDGKYIVDSISDQDASLLKRLTAHGIRRVRPPRNRRSTEPKPFRDSCKSGLHPLKRLERGDAQIWKYYQQDSALIGPGIRAQP